MMEQDEVKELELQRSTLSESITLTKSSLEKELNALNTYLNNETLFSYVLAVFSACLLDDTKCQYPVNETYFDLSINSEARDLMPGLIETAQSMELESVVLFFTTLNELILKED